MSDCWPRTPQRIAEREGDHLPATPLSQAASSRSGLVLEGSLHSAGLCATIGLTTSIFILFYKQGVVKCFAALRGRSRLEAMGNTIVARGYLAGQRTRRCIELNPGRKVAASLKWSKTGVLASRVHEQDKAQDGPRRRLDATKKAR